MMGVDIFVSEEHLLDCGPEEERPLSDKVEEETSKAEDVGPCAERRAVEYFRRHVAWCPASLLNAHCVGHIASHS